MHALLIGGPFLLAFSGGIVALEGTGAESLTPEGIRERVMQLAAVSGALVCFGLLGTFPPISNALGG